jgi:hypothetical protein
LYKLFSLNGLDVNLRRILMKNLYKHLGIITIGVVIGFGLLSCASTLAVRSDPFQTGSDSNRSFVVIMGQGSRIQFDNRKGDSLKVNGVTITTNEFSLPIAQSYEFKFRADLVGRGFFGFWRKYVGKADIVYNFQPGKTYLVAIQETVGGHVTGVLLGALAPSSVRVVVYEYASNLKDKTQLAEFPAYNLKDKDF